MVMQVHDELVFEVPDDELDWAKSELPRLMAGVAQLTVPLLAEVGVGAQLGRGALNARRALQGCAAVPRIAPSCQPHVEQEP